MSEVLLASSCFILTENTRVLWNLTLWRKHCSDTQVGEGMPLYRKCQDAQADIPSGMWPDSFSNHPLFVDERQTDTLKPRRKKRLVLD